MSEYPESLSGYVNQSVRRWDEFDAIKALKSHQLVHLQATNMIIRLDTPTRAFVMLPPFLGHR